MKYFELFALHFFLISTAGAEPSFARGGPAHPPAQEHRRTELRSALLERRVPVVAQLPQGAGQSRRLSEKERADLRLQLRRQSPDHHLSRAP
jgi:hypothetical protein